nr:MAG TPA: hypothetical protein [Caudoviricetes sp.]
MSNILNWITFSAALLLIAAYGGCEVQPAKTPPPAWDAAKTRQEVEADIAWMRRMNAVETEQAARDAEAVKTVEEADRTDWHPPYEPIGD